MRKGFHEYSLGCEGRRRPMWGRASPRGLSPVFADLVTDHAADRGTTDGSDGAAAREDRSAHRTDAGADGGVLVTLGHARATTQAHHRCQGQRSRYGRGSHLSLISLPTDETPLMPCATWTARSMLACERTKPLS